MKKKERGTSQKRARASDGQKDRGGRVYRLLGSEEPRPVEGPTTVSRGTPK